MDTQRALNNKSISDKITSLLDLNELNQQEAIGIGVSLVDDNVNATSLEHSDNSNVNTGLLQFSENHGDVDKELADHLSKICRTCLEVKSDLRPLYENCLSDMVMAVAAVSVNVNFVMLV